MNRKILAILFLSLVILLVVLSILGCQPKEVSPESLEEKELAQDLEEVESLEQELEKDLAWEELDQEISGLE